MIQSVTLSTMVWQGRMLELVQTGIRTGLVTLNEATRVGLLHGLAASPERLLKVFITSASLRMKPCCEVG